jgi:short-subunit dehydrogenase
MPTGGVVVTGVARRSLGEAIVDTCLRRMPNVGIVGIDRTQNPDLNRRRNFREVIFDLNPLSCTEGVEAFASALRVALLDAVVRAGINGVAYLVQSAGVYDFGTFLDHDARRRRRVLGLNILGTTEVLHAVMALNAQFNWPNDEAFVHVLVGSFHGLHASAGRSLYGPSKAFGIDLCASLFAGAEVARCMYIAPGPIDTPMLHRNHWVAKAGGSESFFDKMLDGPADEYESIFLHCEEAALERVARAESGSGAGPLKDVFARYRDERRKAREREMGVLDPQVCATAVVDRIMLSDSESGVYVLRADQGGTGLVCEVAAFSSLDRGNVLSSHSGGQ